MYSVVPLCHSPPFTEDIGWGTEYITVHNHYGWGIKVPLFEMILPFLLIIFIGSAFLKMPNNKKQQGIWRVECELGVISDPDCPVDGGWAPWGPWSPCQGSCDNIGHRRRSRDCINPPPSKDGIPCSGPDEQLDTCYLNNCTLEDFRIAVKGDQVRMEALKQLETIPALPERCLQMECPYEAVEASLAAENTWRNNPESLWNSLLCVKSNVGCELSGGWSSWGPWSECDARCGRGTRWRVRRCDTPPPSAAHLTCEGFPLLSEPCEGNQCANYLQYFEPDSGGHWSDWGPWSQCSEVCGRGVMKRRRICNEATTSRIGQLWGTHCRGQHEQLKMCLSEKCRLNGGWSGWSAWGPCTQSCGAGRRTRSRSCTRPAPSPTGAPCVGPRTEIGACYIKPCETYSHTVAIMNGDGYLHYNFERKHSTMMHFYMRFKPLSPHGSLVRRGPILNPLLRVSLQNWHICVDATGDTKSCSLRRICTSTAIEPGVWHSIMVAVTTESVSMRLDDVQAYIKGPFPCDPDLPDMKMVIWIGEKLHGEIQEVILNFIPLKLKIYHDNKEGTPDFFPFAASNIAYEKADTDEAFLTLSEDRFLRFPCFINQEEWNLELTIKSKSDFGSIIFLHDDKLGNWLYVSLQNMRLKVKIGLGEMRYESISSSDFPPEEWIDITVSKKGDTQTIEAFINSGEKLHLNTNRENIKKHEHQPGSIHTPAFTPKAAIPIENRIHIDICNDEFYVGGAPGSVRKLYHEDFTPFSGIIASLRINGMLQDLNAVSDERVDNGRMQVSSRTASISGSYHEVVWGRSNLLNLTCLHARLLPAAFYTATWLYLDTEIYNNLVRGKTVRSIDDGRVLRLAASADNDLRGFYTCRAHTNKRTHNIVTYGVMGQVKHQLPGPDMTTALAVVSTLTLVITAITWIIYEGIRDLRSGYGFFRDHNLSPQEEADVICDYIDQNMDLIGSKSAARLAKARARRKARQMLSRLSFGAQEPEGILQVLNRLQIQDESTGSEPELPTLPEAKSCVEPQCQQVYKCDHSYVSSALHGSPMSEGSQLSSEPSSTKDFFPHKLCSQLLLPKTKTFTPSKESLLSRRASRLLKVPAIANKSSTIGVVNEINSPGYKVLHKFYQLKRDD